MKIKHLLKKSLLLLALMGGATSAWGDTVEAATFGTGSSFNVTSSGGYATFSSTNSTYGSKRANLTNGSGTLTITASTGYTIKAITITYRGNNYAPSSTSELTASTGTLSTTTSWTSSASGGDNAVTFTSAKSTGNAISISGLSITYGSTSGGKTALTGGWTNAAPTFVTGSAATIPTFSVFGGTLDTDYTVEYTKTDASGIVTLTGGNGAISAINTTSAATATVTATVTVVNTEEYEMETTSYDCEIKVIEPITVFDASANNATFVLTKANITDAANAFITNSTDNWNAGKTYAGYSGDFYNMSNTDRKLTMTVSGATCFEVYVQNGTNGRTYTVKVGDAAAKTITHGGKNVESSGVIATGTTDEVTIVIAGGGDSVYPVYIKFNPTVSATIGSTGWTTFSSAYPLDLSNMTASTGTVTAYYASATGADCVIMTPTNSSAVIANEGLMLKGSAGATITIPVAASAGSALSGNMLVGCYEEKTLSTNESQYVLVNNGGTAEFQCLDEYGATIPAGKAYLDLGLASSARSLRIVFAGDITGISEAKAEAAEKDGKFVENGMLVIKKNGKKFNAAGAQLY